MPIDAEAARWKSVLARIEREIDAREALLAAGRLDALRAPSMDVPEELGPVPQSLVGDVHRIVERLAAQQALVEREMQSVGRELARTASVRGTAPPRSVGTGTNPAFEARA